LPKQVCGAKQFPPNGLNPAAIAVQVVADAGVRNKVPDGFRDVLKSIKKANIRSNIDTH
jgi:hypothetical protein